MENSNQKNRNIETKHLNNMQTNQFLKVYNSLLELEKYFIELKGRESKDKEVDDMDKFEEKQMNKIRAIKNI